MLWAKKNFEDKEWKAFDLMPKNPSTENPKESMDSIPRLYGEIKDGKFINIKTVNC